MMPDFMKKMKEKKKATKAKPKGKAMKKKGKAKPFACGGPIKKDK